MRTVPTEIARPSYADTGEPRPLGESDVKTAAVIERIRHACDIASEILEVVAAEIKPGVTTEYIDEVNHQAHIERGAYPSPLNYHGYPKSICTSVNDVICHGIPDSRVLREGDIVNLDVTAFVDGVHGDTNATFPVGQIHPRLADLIESTHEALLAGIAAARPGAALNAIGRAIEQVANPKSLGVVRAFVGHGIGETFHTGLAVPHYYDPRANLVIEENMVFTIEPMISLGSPRHRLWGDDWTAVTEDGSPTAQFEHTVLITPDGAVALTRHPGRAKAIGSAPRSSVSTKA